jgi:hypothetical protein
MNVIIEYTVGPLSDSSARYRARVSLGDGDTSRIGLLHGTGQNEQAALEHLVRVLASQLFAAHTMLNERKAKKAKKGRR